MLFNFFIPGRMMSRITGDISIRVFALLWLLMFQQNGLSGQIRLEKDKVRIVCSDKEENPLKLAVKALQSDLASVLGTSPPLSDTLLREISETEIVIINRASGHMKVPDAQLRELDGFESHRVYFSEKSNRIYLLGNDLRGTIYAIYTFAEEVLGVPPLKYWCTWKPEIKEEISIAAGLDIYFPSPQVRYRSILPGDQDFFTPWRKLSAENDKIWLETALRLKMNTVETYSTILPHYTLTDYAYLIDKYGLVITSHHTSGLNTSFRTWGDYWREMRHMKPPEYKLSNEKAIREFFRYNAETVQQKRH